MGNRAYETLRNSVKDHELVLSLVDIHQKSNNEELQHQLEIEIKQILKKYDQSHGLPKVGESYMCKRGGYINTNYIKQGDIVSLTAIQIGTTIDLIILVGGIRQVSLSYKDFRKRFYYE